MTKSKVIQIQLILIIHTNTNTQAATTRSITGKADTDIRSRTWFLLAKAKPTLFSIDWNGRSPNTRCSKYCTFAVQQLM